MPLFLLLNENMLPFSDNFRKYTTWENSELLSIPKAVWPGLVILSGICTATQRYDLFSEYIVIFWGLLSYYHSKDR